MRRDSIIIGLALFSMFFGAGNLIFPPYLGMESGSQWPIGIACFIVIDVVLSCVAIYALCASSSTNALNAVDNALGRKSGTLLSCVAILSIGAFIAVPRTAATTYEMSIVSLTGNNFGLFAFSLVYFGIVFLLTFRQSHVIDIIGKFWTPTIVVGVLIIIVAGIVHPVGFIGEPLTPTVAQQGVKAGYQTMDILGAVGFAIIILNTIREKGYSEKKQQLRIIAGASILAAVLLAVLYGGLSYLGANAQSFGTQLGQAALIVVITQKLLGSAGVVVLAIIVGFACLTTAVGLIGSLASYFVTLSKGKLNYKAIVAIDCVIGVVICNLGLSSIIALAEPILVVIYPPFMVTIILLLFYKHIHYTWLYRGAALGAFVAAAILALHSYAGLWPVLQQLPLTDLGFAWLPFSVLGGMMGWGAQRFLVQSEPTYLKST